MVGSFVGGAHTDGEIDELLVRHALAPPTEKKPPSHAVQPEPTGHCASGTVTLPPPEMTMPVVSRARSSSERHSFGLVEMYRLHSPPSDVVPTPVMPSIPETDVSSGDEWMFSMPGSTPLSPRSPLIAVSASL